jgi:hypothetical protein
MMKVGIYISASLSNTRIQFTPAALESAYRFDIFGPMGRRIGELILDDDD